MEQRFTQTQLAEAIAEIEKLLRQRELELTPEQVREILRELNLPDELLEEAIAQVRRREALEQQQRRHRWIAIATAVLAIAIVVTGFLFWQNQQQQNARIVAGQDRIALSETSGDSLTQLSLQTNLRVYYNVTLENAPVDRKLSLQCDWIDPSGQIVHQGRYQTRAIATPIWNTYCFYNIGSAAKPGNWEVRMSLDGRVISDRSFMVQ